MNTYVIITEALVFALLFTALVLSTYTNDRKHSPSSIHNYPPDIQEEYFRTHERVDISYRSSKVILAKTLGIVFFTLILAFCAKIAGARTFKEGFIFTFLMMVWIGCYDTFFIDWILFANLKTFRLEGTEHMDAAYHQKWFHLKVLLFPGLIFAFIPSALVGFIISIVR